MIDLLWLDGTWSRHGVRSSVSEALRRAVDGAQVRFRYVDYPASYGPATGHWDLSIAESVAVGRRSLVDAIRATSNLAVIGGYSQGAMAAVEVARDVLPRDRSLEVLAVAALGNPYQPVHVGRGGIAGQINVPRLLLSHYAPGDPISDLPLGSPLRSIADVTEWMSLRSPEASWLWWQHSILDRALDAKFQAWWQPWRWRDVASAVDYVNGYLGTRHTSDYISGGYVQRLARQIEELA